MFLLLDWMTSLYNLYINPWSDVWFANIFFYWVGCLFILSMISFAVCRSFHFTLKVIPLVYLCFCFLFFWCQSQETFQKPMSRSLPPCFLLGAYGFSLYLQVVDPIWVNFCMWSKTVVQCSQHHLLKRLSFPHYIFLAPLS